MNDITLRIPCETYLAQWFTFDSGGNTPVRLRKYSPEIHLLHVLLASKSSRSAGGNSPGRINDAPEDYIEVLIPHFKGMPPEYFNYISPRAERIFTDLIRRRFDLKIFNDLVPVIEFVPRRDELIYEWMELNGIEPTERNWFAVSKRLSRMLERMKSSERVRKYRARKKIHQKQFDLT